MTSLLSCFVATLALGADSDMKGLPFGIPPAPDDAVIAGVAPPHCLLYVNWAGTAPPNASSGSETEKLLAEPEVQDLLGSVNRLIVNALRKADTKISTPGLGAYASSDRSIPLADLPAISPDLCPPPVSDKPAIPPQPLPLAAPGKPAFSISAEDYGDWIEVLLTHPTAVFVEDVKVTPPHEGEKTSDAKSDEMRKPAKKNTAGGKPAITESPQAIVEAGRAFRFVPMNLDIQGGMVVSLGSDSARLHAKFIKYLRKAKKAGLASDFELVEIAGQTWYRSKPNKLGFASNKVFITFGFRGQYFVAGIGEGAIEGILGRWNHPAPAWLTTALEETPVPRRTGIIYANLKSLRETLLPLIAQTNYPAELEMLGLANVDSLVSTAGLEDRGIINRMELTIDGKPCGLFDMVPNRPLSAKDLQPIPADALMAFAARVDVKRAIDMLISRYEKAAAGDEEAKSSVSEMRKDYGAECQRILAAVGDTWCIYNSPTEGEAPFLGWTAVVPIRDRAALLENCKAIFATNKAQEAAKEAAKERTPNACELYEPTNEIRTCRFAGHEIYYLAGQVMAPAACILDHELVMTLNMPAMKAYLTRKDHHSLAAQPGVKLALSEPNGPVALGYCDTPKLFDVLYPMFSCAAIAGASAAQNSKLDLDPTYWPSAPSIRRHLRPDITTVERSPHGLKLTCRYSLPTGGATGPLCLYGMQMLSVWNSSYSVAGPSVIPASADNPNGAPQEGTCEAVAVDAECSPPTPNAGPIAQCPRACQLSSAPAQPAAQTASLPMAPRCPVASDYPAAGYPTATVCPATPYVGTSIPCPAQTTVAAPSALLAYEMPAGSCSAYPMTAPNIPLGAAPAAPPCGYAPAASYGASTTTSPYSAPATAPYNYGSFNSGLSCGTAGVAKNPAFGAAVTVSDVIAMTRAKVANELIISQFRNHGLAAPLRPADVITLSQSGVSTEVIAALQTAVAKEELCDPSPYHAAPTVMNSNYETIPPPVPATQAPAKPIERSAR